MSKQVSQTSPEPIIKGRFALYETADGGYHLSYTPDGVEAAEHVNIPGMYVKLAMKQYGKGGLRRLLGMMS